MRQIKIAIIVAMEKSEIDYIKSKLENLKKVQNNLYNIFQGEFDGKEIILCVSDIGLINTANAVTYVIEKYHPDVIINEGVAGGYGNDVHKGDLVIGSKCINITQINTKKREIGEGIKAEDYILTTFLSAEENRLVYEDANSALISKSKEIENKYDRGKIHYGVIGSGDIWNREKDKILYYNNKYGIKCEDMEAIAVYKIANKYGIPVISIKSISNNEVLDEEYDKKLAVNSQEFTLELIKNIK